MDTSPSRVPFAPDHVLLFKHIPSVQNAGCRAFVWLPTETAIRDWTQSLPVALMFHGGGWLMGSADMVPYNQVRYFLEHGVAVISFEYRMLPHFSLQHIREDLLDAYLYIQDRVNLDLKEAGSFHTIDGSRACILGWSAGGSNVLWLAQEVHRHNSRRPEATASPIRAVVSTYPLTKLDAQPGPRSNLEAFCEEDTTGYLSRSLNELRAEHPSASFKVHPVYIQQRHSALDSAALRKMQELYAAGVPVPSALKPPPRVQMGIVSIMAQCLSALLVAHDPPFAEADSPINAVNAEFPPTVVVVATNDTLIPTDHSYDLYQRLEDHGVDAMLVECHGMTHGEAEALSGSDWDPRWWSSGLKPSLDFALAKLGVSSI